ncbi:MAG: AI-2E family transporter [candidate division KSB1 bacterium]|nr:AI-2E family transporter [candidate division KSB1 bacterium]
MSDHNQAPVSTEQPQAAQRTQVEKLGRLFLLAVLIGIGIIFFNMVKIFLVPVMMAAVFAAIFHPLYRRLLKITGQKKSLSAAVCCLVLLLVLLIPTYLIANLVANEAIAFYQTAEQNINEIIAQGDAGLLGRIKQSKWVERLHLDQVDWQTGLQEVAKNAAAILATVINKASSETFQVVTSLFLTLFTMYYFFKDGESILRRIKYLSPLPDRYEDELISRFAAVSRATIKGNLLIALLKGTLGALTFWLFGVGSPVLWGVVMTIFSMIPMLGAPLVMLPAAIFLMFTGHVLKGIVLALIALVVIGNIDNVLGPRLVARGSGMHDLMVFFATLGGISVFGVMGFVVGPIIAALFLTVLDVYSIEFGSDLDLAQNLNANAETQGNSATHTI